MLESILAIFEIYHFVTIPGLFEYLSENWSSQKKAGIQAISWTNLIGHVSHLRRYCGLSNIKIFFCRTQVLFVGPLKLLFWTSGDICPMFQSQGGFPHLHASLPMHNRFLRFTSGATPADLLMASMAAEPFHSGTFTCVQALVGSSPGSCVLLPRSM